MFGHQRSNTSLFAPASGTQQQSGGTGLFGSTGTSSGFGSSTFGQQQSGFGGTATSQPQQTTGFGGFGASTSQPQQTSTFSGFGTSTSQPQQSTFGGFGASSTSQPQQSATTFGTVSSGQTTSSIFSTPSSQPQQTSGLGGFGTTSNQAQQSSTFGGFGTTNTSQPQQTSTFGGFGTGSNQTSSSSLGFGGFGAKYQPATSSATTSTLGSGGLFGNQGTKPTTSTFGSLTGPSTQQPQQQQQKDSLLSLHTAFPDTSVPYFIVRPDKLTRTIIGAGLRNKEADDISKYYTEQPVFLGKRRQKLPEFLTAATAPSTAKSTPQKRTIETGTQLEGGPRFKTHVTNRGIFGASAAAGGFGDNRNISNSKSSNDDKAKSDENEDMDAPPVASIWDIGVNPRKYSSDLDLSLMSASDVWTASVTRSRTVGKLLPTPSVTPNPSEKLIPETGQTIVKVFGFPIEMKAKVIEYFTQLGKVVERYQSKSNWITVRYAGAESTKKALEMHGKAIADDCMVAVIVVKSMVE